MVRSRMARNRKPVVCQPPLDYGESQVIKGACRWPPMAGTGLDGKRDINAIFMKILPGRVQALAQRRDLDLLFGGPFFGCFKGGGNFSQRFA